ncbi:protein toll-like [Polistes fuscatus]|uniref:protein toll-like n=1 Tax=Polistes fuscatus TaxID=30207 RepID=UPI001CA9B31F|nr:protein toll-like [Polistes fuscatus]
MIFKIFVIFLITFTPINNTPCQDSPTCECSSKKSDELNIACDVENITAYTVNIKSRNNIQIVCKNWRTWEDFYIKGRLSEKRIQSLSFEKCGLSDDTTLRNVVRQLGVRDTHTLIFKSFKNLFGKLKRQHLQGFRSVKSLVLSDNGLTDISNNLLLDFPELEHIDLSNNNLNLPVDIFDTTLNLRRIVLISSGIDIIPVGIFYMLKNLESLNIISNNLEKIQEGTFDQLESLTSLNLANNLLSELQSKIFYKLMNLEKLDISMNNFSTIPQKLFYQNKKLQQLYLESNLQKMITLPDNLLANLTMLSGVQLNNNGFSFLPENLFWGSSSLQYIFLNDNSLVTLPKNFFRGLNQVRRLSIKNNKIEILPSKIFEDMEELGILDLSNNRIVRVSRNLFLGMPLLYELNMERNQLQVIHKTGLAPLTNLCIARFSHNPLKLTHVNGRLSVFYKNHYLEELYLSNSSIYNFFDDWSSGNHNLRLLDLSHNFISNITASSFILPSRKTAIDLRYNKISNIHFHKFEEKVDLRKEEHQIFIFLAHNPILCGCPLYDLLRYRERKMSPSGRLSEKRIQSLNFKNCGLSNDTTLRNVVKQLGVRDTHTLIFKSFKNLSGRLKRHNLQGFESVKSVVLSDNGLIDISNNLLLDFPELEHIDLSNNNLELPNDIFDATPNLKKIELVSSGLDILPGGIFYITLPDNLLANLTKLHYVQLNGNGFLFLPENLFWGSSSLEYIFLSENSLVTLPKKIFRGLNKVKKLSLKNNEIETLPSKIFEDMEELKYLICPTIELLVYQEAFVPFTNLRIAMLSHNPLKLSYVNGKLSVFFTNQYLEELHLANSSIYHFSDEWFSGNDNLKFLDLTYNFISNITFEEMADKRKENHAIVIRLAHNPILCGCPLYDLLLYREGKMSRRINKYFIIKVGNLKCIQSDGKNVTKVSQLSSKTYKCLQHEYFYTENRCQNNCSCYIRPSDLSQSVDC